MSFMWRCLTDLVAIHFVYLFIFCISFLTLCLYMMNVENLEHTEVAKETKFLCFPETKFP